MNRTRFLRRPRSAVGAAREWWRAATLDREAVRAQRPPARSRFGAFGEGSVIVPPAWIAGPEHIRLGSGVVILEHAVLEALAEPGSPAPVITIADGCRINRFVRISCRGAVTLGEGVLIADRVVITDAEPEPGPLVQGARRFQRPAPVLIGPRVLIGAGSVIMPGVTIGEGAYVSASSVVDEDVPPHTLVTGAPARRIRQWDPSA